MNRIFARRLRSTVNYVMIGLLLGPIIGLLTGALDGLPIAWPAARGAIGGLVIGIAVGAGEEFFLPYASRRLSFFWLSVLRFGAYFAVMQGTLLVINVARLVLGADASITSGALSYVGGGYFLRDLGFTVLASIVIIAALQLKRLHHASELWRLVTGRYHYPEEEELVFLFVDLAQSTAIAERLGHLGFSRLLRDMFADLSEPVLAWRGRVYQHVGDGMVVTWTPRSLGNGAPVQCFFDMTHQLETHDEHYRKNYGVSPTLRAAVHVGPVVTTWVGEAKKELAYHGDTLNVTSRMQGACKGLAVRLLISERVLPGAEAAGLQVRSMGEVQLEGKGTPATLFAVDNVAPVP